MRILNPQPSDAELVARALSGDLRALEALMRLHSRMLFRTARAILRDDAEAEDAVQEACLQAFRSLGSFRGESRLTTWLVRITANEALMRRRRNARTVLAAPGDAHVDNLVSSEPGPERDAQRGEMRRELEAKIDALPEDYRAVFMLRALEDLSVEETAAALGIPEATVRTRYFRARGLLRRAMADKAGERSSLETPLRITDEDLERLTLLKPHAALLREIRRAVVISPKAAIKAEVVTMNTQVLYTDHTARAQRQVNIVYPQEAGGCACSVSILGTVGTALIGLSAGQAIEWDFPDGTHRRLRVEKVIHSDCPLKASSRRTARSLRPRP